MYTSHNFCPVSVTALWLPSLSVQEKGTSSLSTRAPSSPFLLAQFLFFGEHCAKQLTIREDNKCFIEEKQKSVWKGMCSAFKGSGGQSKQCQCYSAVHLNMQGD